ncbi:unnamed protein product [Scytosiphon promiscuus]
MATTTVKAAYFGYKAFQAFRLIMGDVTVVGEVVAELLVEGLGEAALEAAVEASAEHVVALFENAKDLNESVRNFNTFCNKLSVELGADNPDAKALIDAAQELYQLFVDIDTDNSGTISRQELQGLFARLGYSSQVANEQFDYLDTDGDGEVSFEEFAKMLGPPPGRHEDASEFDCRGRHGLKTHKWETIMICDWCQGVIPSQTRLVACLTCDVDACHNCTAERMEPAAQRITCKARHGLVKMKIAGINTCSACKGHIADEATLFSCRQTCPVYVCVGCVLNVPEDLYFTGLRHVR